MNAIVAQMLGEADHHSPEEKAQLASYAKPGNANPETDRTNPEEAREVQIAKRLRTLANQSYANRRNDAEGRAIAADITALADELLAMHQVGTPKN